MAGSDPGGDVRLDLSSPRTVHVVGAGGAGMSAIATVLAQMGHRVSGSDAAASAALDRLASAGVRTWVGHDPAALPDGLDALTRSTAVGDDDPEVGAARASGVPVLSRADALAAICAQKRTIAVAGTHGKTTTSSLLATALRAGGASPSFLIGAVVADLGAAAAWEDGEWFVVEADESDGTFLDLPRRAAIVTNAEPDHLEHYGGWAQLEAAFRRFVVETEGPVLCCADDDGARRLAAEGALTYGEHPDATYRMRALRPTPRGFDFELWHGDAVLAAVSLPLPGLHNARNAAAALAMVAELGVDLAPAAAALGRFEGVARRFEVRGEAAGVAFVDDYAHLPTEVEAAISAARQAPHDRVVVAFQPHRYSRTEALWRDFAHAFDGADLLVVTDIYSSGEQPRPGVRGKLVCDAVLDADPRARVAWMPRRQDLLGYLTAELRRGDLCLTLGAGDLTTLPDELLAALSVDDGQPGAAER